jgi:ABC-type sugar transport system ATPase subunit
MMGNIRVTNLGKGYGGPPVLQGVSFELRQGERLVVLGPSGSGKSTLLRLLAGLDLPDAGEIWLGERLASRPGWGLPPYERAIGMAFQAPTLWPHMTVAQNLLFGLDHANKDQKQWVLEELAPAFELSGLLRRYPGQLSGGEARRVGLARALAPRRPILLLDEPLTNLNAELKTKVLSAALKFVDTFHPTLLYVTHDLTEAEALGAQVLRLEKGRGE